MGADYGLAMHCLFVQFLCILLLSMINNEYMLLIIGASETPLNRNQTLRAQTSAWTPSWYIESP